MMKPERKNSGVAPGVLRTVVLVVLAAGFLGKAAEDKELPTEVVKVIAPDLGFSKRVSLVLLGPKNWRHIQNSNATRLGFIETKTGRVILDLEEKGFCGFNGQNSLPRAEAVISPDRTRVAAVVQWKHNGDWALFEIEGAKVSELRVERADCVTLIRERCKEIREGGFSRNIWVRAFWESNDELWIDEEGEFGFKGDSPEQTHEIKLRSSYVRKVDGGLDAALFIMADGKKVWSRHL